MKFDVKSLFVKAKVNINIIFYYFYLIKLGLIINKSNFISV